MEFIEKYERILFGAKQALRENDCKFIRESICEYETVLAALRAYKPTAEEAAEIDKTIDELKRLRIALATSRCDGKRGITPAYAGSTKPGLQQASVSRDHPRIRGEHV